MRPETAPPRRLRDVADVDAYVREAVGALRPCAGEAVALHAQGVRAVLRLERALPPGAPLMPVLDAVLAPRLAALHGESAFRSGIPAAA